MLAQGGIQRQQQSQGMAPEHIMGKAVLKMDVLELRQFMESQLAQNPALSLEEGSVCPACGCSLTGPICPVCGSRRDEEDYPYDGEEFSSELWPSDGDGGDEYYEPFARVSTPVSLYDHLIAQIPSDCPHEDMAVIQYLISALDDDGYMREPILEIAGRFGRSVPQIEACLSLLQSFDPVGVGARDLRECILVQLALAEPCAVRALAETIVRDRWAEMERMRLDRIASRLGVDSSDVSEAVLFIRKRTNPRPADGFRDPWERFAPRRVPRSSPDIAVSLTEHGLASSVAEAVTGKVDVDGSYAEIMEEMSSGKSHMTERDKAHIRESVAKARALIDALEFRKSTLRRIVDELLRLQAGFFTEGPSALKPLTRKELAAKVGLHESTISRATQGKTLRLPSGEVISFDVLFDSALPVKEMVRRLATEHMTDGEIAERLTSEGVQIARRTVAKYREQMGVLAIGYRVPEQTGRPASP